MRIPVQSSVLSANDTVTESGSFLAVMAGDCGDEIPSKSKPQPAGVTSCANFANLLKTRYLYSFFFDFSIFVPEVLVQFLTKT